MKYKTFGKTGLRVSELALGAMTFGEEVAWGSGKEESRKVFDAFAEAGGNFIDTANVYTQGTSERFVGEFMGSDRERFVLATKFVFSTDSRDPNASGSNAILATGVRGLRWPGSVDARPGPTGIST